MRTAIVNIGRLATMAGPNRARRGAELRTVGLLERAAVVTEAGRIQAVGAMEDANIRKALAQTPEESIVDAAGRLVTPGLIDAHTHVVFGGHRAGEFHHRCAGATYEQIAASGGGIRSTVAATRAAADRELVEATTRRMRWMMASGTTLAEVKSGYGLELNQEMRLLDAAAAASAQAGLPIVPTFLALHAVPEGISAQAYTRDICDSGLPAMAARGDVRFVDAFIESGYFGPDEAQALADAARREGIGLRLHVDQLAASGGAELAVKLGAVAADHLEQTGASGIAALANSSTLAGLLPMSVTALRKGRFAAGRDMLDAGVAVYLATDFNPGSSPSPSLPLTMSLACLEMGFTAEEALSAVTIQAAASLGLAESHGSIEVGKSADLVLWDLEDPAEIPYWIGAPAVRAIWIRGAPHAIAT